MNKQPYLYFDIGKEERDTAIRYLLNAILRSRMDLNIKHSIEEFDEDVNVYLAHLLFAVALPEYHELAEPYLSTESSDVIRWVQATDDRTIRYFIFKVNADHLLIHSAVFDDLTFGPRRRSLFRRSARQFEELGRLYYEQASSYHTRIYRKKTGVGAVLHKLSRYFDVYSDLLRTVRRDYLNFVTRFRDQVFDQFLQELHRYEHKASQSVQIDHFLDLYGEWLRTKDPALEAEAHQALQKIKKFDPQFGKGIFNRGTPPS